MARQNTAHSNSPEPRDYKTILEKMKIYREGNLLQHEIDEIVQSQLLKEAHEEK